MGKMRIQPLRVRHFVSGKFFRSYKVRRHHAVIGSTKDADIRLNNGDISGVACLFEKQDKGWSVLDMGSEPNVKMDGKSFVDFSITGKHVLQVNEHTFEIDTFKAPKPIFRHDYKNVGSGNNVHVVRWKGNIICVTTDGEEANSYNLAKDHGITVNQYDFGVTPPVGLKKPEMAEELKKPLGGTAVTFLVLVMLALLWPKPDVEEVKPKDNQFTKMIYDGKILEKKKRQVVAGFAKRTKTGTGAGNGSISEGAKGATSKASKAVISLRKSGLQSVIGRIAARAANNAKLLAVIAGGTNNSGRGPASIGNINAMPSTGAVSGVGSIGNGKGFKVGGIGTGGKGGGVGGYKDGTGLGTGTIGNGEVALDDEESVIEGGLEREIIAGVIKEKLGQIRYCYERQLSANKDLHGKIKVRWTINPDGAVEAQSVSQTTLNSALVEECILRRIATWRFPKPKNGTKVIVSYPFLFKSVN